MSNKKESTRQTTGKANSTRKKNNIQWNHTRPIRRMKNNGFGGEVKWKFPEGTTFEKGHWYRKVLLKEHEKMKEEKKLKSSFKRMEISQNPWKRKVDLTEISSDDESEDDSWNGIFMTDRDMQASKRRRKVPTKIIKDMNKMTAQHERVLEKC